MLNSIYTYTARNKKETKVVLEENGIRLWVWSKRGGEDRYFYPYRELKRIHLSLPDIGWYTMEITFDDGRRILLRSLTFGTRVGDKMVNASVKQHDGYRQLAVQLHNRLIDLNLQQQIRFRQGSIAKALLCLVIVGLCLFAFIPMAWYTRSYGLLLTFAIAVPGLSLFAFRTGRMSDYEPTQIPQKYLP